MPLLLKRKNYTARFFREKLSDSVHLDMMLIPGGSFYMGSLETEEGRSPSESPQHLVKVPTFCLGKYPITQAQWQAIMGSNPSTFKVDERLPVDSVTWLMAIEFCTTLSKLTKSEYRLPSEAEWEYACRAGTTTPFHFGETLSTDLANYNGDHTYAHGFKGVYRKATTPVGTFPPNIFGLHDMHGNVWEWCQDTWHDDYVGAPINGSAWVSDRNDNDYYSLRGGSWEIAPHYCHSASRYHEYDTSYVVGFRVVCEAARTP